MRTLKISFQIYFKLSLFSGNKKAGNRADNRPYFFRQLQHAAASQPCHTRGKC